MKTRFGFDRLPQMFAFARRAGSLAFLCLLAATTRGAIAQAPAPAPRADRISAEEEREYCNAVAASAELIRLDRKRKEIAALEAQLQERLAALQARQAELGRALDRLESFERKSSDALIGLYSRMKPESAAAQLAQLDDDLAAATMLQLKSKISSAILGEMEAARGAALARRIAELRNARDGHRP